MKRAVRILVADDHEVVRKGLLSVLCREDGWCVCSEAVNGLEAVEKARAQRPDIVIMDLTMPELNGLEATRQIRKELPDTKVLILTIHESQQVMHEVLEAGASGYVLKSDAGDMLKTAIEALCAGKPFFTSSMAEMMLRAYLDPSARPVNGSPAVLTPREREIVQLVAEGKSSKEVATRCGISVKTAETHRANIMRKLEIHSVSELVRYAIRNHIITA